jgi:hypothetical protein
MVVTGERRCALLFEKPKERACVTPRDFTRFFLDHNLKFRRRTNGVVVLTTLFTTQRAQDASFWPASGSNCSSFAFGSGAL